MIEQIAQYGVEQLGADPKVALRAFDKHFRKVICQQENVEAVVREAQIDLIEGRQDYSDIEGDISEEFYDRFEEYSASANTEELRQRWGRVLASEIRTPGTFSPKVLRIVDEIDQETALLFEKICQFRMGNTILVSLMPELEVMEKALLVGADLLVDPGEFGQRWIMPLGKLTNGEEAYFCGTSVLSFTLLKDDVDKCDFGTHLGVEDGSVGVSVNVLTKAGEAIASILPDRTEENVRRIAGVLAHIAPSKKVLLFKNLNGVLSSIGYAPHFQVDF